jgi:hypothetical protein
MAEQTIIDIINDKVKEGTTTAEALRQKFVTGVGEFAGPAANTLGDIIDSSTAIQNPWNDALNSGQYNFQILKFPQDIDSESGYHGHSMMININVPSYSALSQTSGPDGSGGLYGSPNGPATPNYTVINNQYSRMETLRRYYDNQFTGTDPTTGNPVNAGTTWADVQGISILNRRTRRIKEAIVLYMPSTVNFSSSNDYTPISLTDTIAKGITGLNLGSVGNAAMSTAQNLGGLAATAGKLNNMPINPRVEVLYNNTGNRMFDFQFLFAPSNEQESINVRNIIKTFRFHAAPELSNKGLASVLEPFFMTPPSEFDFTFYHQGKENTNIPRINTCALQRIDVDYAPTGQYSTFSNGQPVVIRMALQFIELSVITKQRIIQGF